ACSPAGGRPDGRAARTRSALYTRGGGALLEREHGAQDSAGGGRTAGRADGGLDHRPPIGRPLAAGARGSGAVPGCVQRQSSLPGGLPRGGSAVAAAGGSPTV